MGKWQNDPILKIDLQKKQQCTAPTTYLVLTILTPTLYIIRRKNGKKKRADDAIQAAFLYGKNLGIAFQLIDDYLDFSASAASLGKPAAADLK